MSSIARNAATVRQLLVVSLAALAGTSCGKDAEGPRVPTQMKLHAGAQQTAVAGSAVAIAPSVVILDANDEPVSDVGVVFAVVSGGGSITGVTIETNAEGIATVGSWTLGTATGANSITATSTGLVGSPFTFNATGTAGAPAQVSLNTGNSQTLVVGTSVSTKPSVLVKDANNNPVPNATVTFAVASGGGSITGGAATTDASGIATVGGWTIGTTVGVNTLTASIAAVTGSPVTFTATGTSSTPTQIAVSAGDAQSATVATTVTTVPAVLVRDQHNNPVSGVTVTFTLGTGGGTITGGTAVTNAAGVAALGSWKLGNAAGSNTVSAAIAQISGSVTFTATGTAGAPTQITVDGGANQIATVATALANPTSVLVRDAFNNVVPNAAVVFAVTAGGGAITGASTTTNSSGIATLGAWTLGNTAGANKVSATVAAVDAITITATGTAGAATQIALSTGDAQSVTVNTAVTNAPAVLVRDLFNNPVAGVSVTFTVASGGGSLTAGTATTDAAGVATVGSWKLGTIAGANTMSAATTVIAATSVTFNATGTAGAATQISLSAGNTQSATVNTNVTTAPSVVVKDEFGNVVAGTSVTFSVFAGGGSLTAGTATTDASGVAVVGSWKLGTTAGANTLRAASTGLTGSPVSVTATGTAGAAAQIAINNGNSQTAIVNTNVTTAPSVVVKDQFNNVVAGQPVTFAVATGNGSVTGASVTSNASGIATVASWKLGTVVGANSITATSTGLTGSPVTVGATSTPDVAAQISLNGGNNQNATVNTTVATAPSVLIQDQFNNVVAGTSVTFSVFSGGGSVTSATATSDANGVATVGSWKLGTVAASAGGFNNILRAASTGLSGSPFQIFAGATPGAVAALTLTQGGGNVEVATAATQAPEFRATDSYGNYVPGVIVNFAVTAGGGSIGAATDTTDAAGLVSTTSFTAGSFVGPNKVQAQAAGSGFTAEASYTGTPGAATQMIQGYAAASATVGTSVSAPSVSIRDQFGNLVSGVSVAFAVTGGGGSIADATPTSQSNGNATAGDWTLGTTAGTNTLTATATGLPTVTFTSTGTAGNPTQVTVNAGNSQSAIVGTAVSTAPSVLLKDQYNNVVENSEVTFAAATGGGSVTTATVNTNASGIATVGSWILGQIIGANTLTATSQATGAGPTFSATGTVGAAAKLAFTTQPATAASGRALITQPAAQITDAYGNLVAQSGTSVTMAVQSGNGSVGGTATATTDANGTATFSNLAITGKGAHKLKASASGLTNGVSDEFSVAIPPATSVATRFATACALTAAGAAYCWGDAASLGDGVGTTNSLSPVAVTGSLTFAQIASGLSGACGVTTGGAGYCWGINGYYQIGDGTNNTSYSPVPVGGGHTFARMAMATQSACGLTTAGELYCWGASNNGELGTGGTGVFSTPTAVAGGHTFVTFAMGDYHSCGIVTNGDAYCWGYRTSGNLGDGDYNSGVQATPVLVSGGLKFTAIAAGNDGSCGLVSDGSAWCWGNGATTPQQLSSPEPFVAIASGSDHTCGQTAGGALYCWGQNSEGQVGTGAFDYVSSPTLVILSGVTSVAAGFNSTCAVVSGSVKCWGQNNQGQTGIGATPAVNPTPALLTGMTGLSELTAGGLATCGIISGAAKCVGVQGGFFTGDFDFSRTASPRSVSGGYAFSSLSAGDRATCGVTPDKVTVCWGINGSGQLGVGNTNTQFQTVEVVGNHEFASVFAGFNVLMCGLTDAGAAWCWGQNQVGQAGDGTTGVKSTPVAVGGGLAFSRISHEYLNACGVTTGHDIYCWGNISLTPVQMDAGQNFASIASGSGWTCGLTNTGAARCWGGSSAGLGDGNAVNSSPAPAGNGMTFTQIAVGDSHACGLTSGGAAYCWGKNNNGQLGDGTTTDRSTPVPVSGGFSFSKLTSTGTSTCGLTTGGAAVCWGENASGRFGIAGYVLAPTTVLGGITFAP